jgi:hypothetical protein
MTLITSRFMASHMMCVRMAPLEPMRAPTTVSMGELSMKPSAQSAQPEYELSTVITTGISAPPMEAVMCAPRAPLRPVVVARAATPLEPLVGSDRNRPPAARLPRPMPMLRLSRCERFIAELSRLPFSLPKATTEPVAVTPPMKVAR